MNSGDAYAWAVSPDGSLVLGSQRGQINLPHLWASSGVTSTFPSSTSLTFDSVAAVTRDNRAFLGTALTPDGRWVPALYRSETKIDALPIPSGATAGYAVDLSEDGKVALCTDAPQSSPYRPKPFLVKDGVATYLPLPDGATIVRMGTLSGDGRTVLGYIDGQSVRWVDGALEPLSGVEAGFPTLSVLHVGLVAVSRDGSTIVGALSYGTGLAVAGTMPFRWSLTEGVQALPTVPGSAETGIVGISDDGKTVLMNVRESADAQLRPYLWKQGLGLRSVAELFAKAGGNASTFNGVNAIALSANGKAIIGRNLFSSSDPIVVPWKLTLP